MKIVQVTHQYPPTTGGVGAHVSAISEAFSERGHDVTVLSADAGADGADDENQSGVTIRRFRSISPGGAFHFAPRMRRAVEAVDADVVHAHNYHALVALSAARGVDDESFIVTPHYHGHSDSAIREQLLKLYRPVGRRVLKRADTVVAVSKWERDQLRADLGVDATVVPNGVEIQRFVEVEPHKRDQPYVLTVGRLEEYKGVQHVIAALTELDGYELIVAGEGPYRGALEDAATRLGVDDRVAFLGYVPDNELPSLYAGAAVHVTLSTLESYGLTVAEALAAGTPCVVRQMGALAEWTGNEGVVGVEDVTPGTTADAIEVADSHSVEAELLDWDDVAERLLEVYTA